MFWPLKQWRVVFGAEEWLTHSLRQIRRRIEKKKKYVYIKEDMLGDVEG